MIKQNAIKTLAVAFLICQGGLALADKHALTHSPKIPGAQGEVNVKKSKNGNYKVSFEVKHLAPPKEVDPSKSTYVVWVSPLNRKDSVQNVGALRVDEDLSGSLDPE